MRFAHVTGILFSDREGYRFEVSLDDRRTVVAVRDERIPDLLRETVCRIRGGPSISSPRRRSARLWRNRDGKPYLKRSAHSEVRIRAADRGPIWSAEGWVKIGQ